MHKHTMPTGIVVIDSRTLRCLSNVIIIRLLFVVVVHFFVGVTVTYSVDAVDDVGVDVDDQVCRRSQDDDCPLAVADAAGVSSSNDDEKESSTLLTTTTTMTTATSCGIYLAPSSIPGAGLGLYAGDRSYNDGDWLGDPDIAVPLYEVDFYKNGQGFEDDEFLWKNYVWNHDAYPGMTWEVMNPNEDMDAANFGLGAIPNYVIPLVNMRDRTVTRSLMSRSGVSSQSPGDGAFTPYPFRRWYANKHIEPYSELFLSYGENYFLDRPEYSGVPLTKDYKLADWLLRKYFVAMLNWNAQTTTLQDDNIQRDLWELVVDVSGAWHSRLKNALPSGVHTTLKDLSALAARGGTKVLPYNQTVKNQAWIEKFGQCVDNIKAGTSTIPHAGRGAFASRFIPMGGLVSPAPLVHVPNRTVMVLYAAAALVEDEIVEGIDENHQAQRRNLSSPVHQQLLLNYCWGHKNSSLLLCPYGHLTLLINHDAHNPNTKVVWSNERHMRHPEWLEQPVSVWGHSMHTGLALDYIAIRDIQEDEEITIDYGMEWERTWKMHVQQFEASPPPRPNYIPGFEWNQLDRSKLPPIPTTSEPWEQQFEANDVLLTIKESHLPKDHGIQPFQLGIVDEEYFNRKLYLCRVVEHQGNDMYKVDVVERPSGILQDTSFDIVKMTLHNVSRSAFFFQDVPYGLSHHQSWSFRHDMRLPDGIFPEIWKDSVE